MIGGHGRSRTQSGVSFEKKRKKKINKKKKVYDWVSIIHLRKLGQESERETSGEA